MTDEEGQAFQQEMTEAIASVLSKYERSMITKWVALIETVTLEDGERSLWQIASEETKSWDVKGMLHHALDQETAKTLMAVMHEED